jgi:hypothetical protein
LSQCVVLGSVADPDPFDTDPDPAFLFHTDPDPAFQFVTGPDPYLFKEVPKTVVLYSLTWFSLSVGSLRPNQKECRYYVKFSFPVNFVVLINVAYGSGSWKMILIWIRIRIASLVLGSVHGNSSFYHSRVMSRVADVCVYLYTIQ